MGIFRLLGFGTNWDRVNKNELRRSLYSTGIVVKNVIHLEDYDYNIEDFFDKNTDDIRKDWAYKVILSFGPDCPTNTEYNRFQEFGSTVDLLPSARKLRKNPALQDSWNIAYQWAKDYEQGKTEVMLATKERQNKNLEQELSVMRAKMRKYQEKVEMLEANRETVLLAKDQEIEKLKEKLEKQKLKFHRLKRKDSYKVFKKNLPELELEDTEAEFSDN